jgi:HEAT repeat protein
MLGLLLTVTCLTGASSLAAQATGGTYRGPGDTVPAGGDPSGGGPGTNPGGPGGPTAPPSPGGPGGNNPLPNPSGPTNPGQPPPGAIPSLDPSDIIQPEGKPGVENPDSWQIWWRYNRWDHLETGGLIRNLNATTGSSGFFLGRGEKVQTNPILRATRGQIRDAAVPALLDALRADGQTEFVVHSLHALAKCREFGTPDADWDFDAAVRHYLRSQNQEITENALLALGIRGENKALPRLTAVLLDQSEGRALIGRTRVSYRARAFAAFGLGILAERTPSAEVRGLAARSLMDALQDERTEVQAACVFALGLCAPRTDEAGGDDAATWVEEARTKQVEQLLAFFADREQALLPRSQVPGALARLVHDAPQELRARVATVLLEASGTRSREPKEIQSGAVIALGRIGRSGGTEVDVEILLHLESIILKGSGDRLTRFLASTALAEAARRAGAEDEPYAGMAQARKLFLRQLSRVRGETLAWTALAAGILENGAEERGEVPSSAVAEALRDGLRHNRSAETSGALSLALGLLGDGESQAILLDRMLGAGEATARGYAALALGMLGEQEARDPMRAALEASVLQPFALQQIAIGLSLLGDQETGQRLFQLLENSSSPELQASIAATLGWIKDPRSLDDLAKRLSDERVSTISRAWTAVAIGRICDQDDLPWNGRVAVGVNYDVVFPTLIEPEFSTGLLDLP